MKNRFIICVLVVLILGVLFWWFLFSRPSTVPAMVHPNQPKATKERQERKGENQSKPEPEKPRSKLERIHEEYMAVNYRPIEFYGKAVDQHGEPVSDAEAVCSLETVDGYRDKTENHTTRTDRNGFFSFTRFKGSRLTVGVRKVPGYYNGKVEGEVVQGYLANYSLMTPLKERHKADPNNPVIFHMWKLAGPEIMVEGEKNASVLCDGTPMFFDLLTGRKVESGGDLKITLQRNPIQGIMRKGFDWKASVEVVGGGGLQEIGNNPFPYVAPEIGYQPSFKVNMPAGTTNWSESVTKTFYIKLRGGKMYGRIQIRLSAFYDPPPTGLKFDYFINPSGSRNLEVDQMKKIKPSRIEQIGLEKAIEEVKGAAASSPALTPEEQGKRW